MAGLTNLLPSALKNYYVRLERPVIMKKHNHQRKLSRFWMKIAIVQALLLLLFLPTLINAAGPKQLQTSEIVVQSFHTTRAGFKNTRHLIITDGVAIYRVPARHSSNEVGASQMKDNLSEGDKITLTYYQTSRWGQTENYVVGAYTETEVFRMVDEYYRSMKGGLVITWVVFIVFECCLATAAILRMTIFKRW